MDPVRRLSQWRTGIIQRHWYTIQNLANKGERVAVTRATIVSAPKYSPSTKDYLLIDGPGEEQSIVGEWEFEAVLWAASKHMGSRQVQVGLISFVNDELTGEKFTPQEETVWARKMLAVVDDFKSFWQEERRTQQEENE